MAAAWLWAVWRIFSLLNTFYCFERENSEEFFIFNVHWIIVKEFTSILDIHSFVKMSSLKLALFPRRKVLYQVTIFTYLLIKIFVKPTNLFSERYCYISLVDWCCELVSWNEKKLSVFTSRSSQTLQVLSAVQGNRLIRPCFGNFTNLFFYI